MPAALRLDFALMTTRLRPSFRRNMAKPTRHQRQVLRALWPRFGLDCGYQAAHDLVQVFGREAPVLLEIGFGLGDALLQHAINFPDWDHVGIEMHKPGIAQLVEAAAEHQLSNLRTIRRDARISLRDHLPNATWQEVWLFFPEPFPREADAERRIVSPLLLDLLADGSCSDTTLRVATDDDSYAEHMQRVIDEHPAWTGRKLEHRFARRPVTKYEQRALDAGRTVHEFEVVTTA